jgi:hypothetical protein
MRKVVVSAALVGLIAGGATEARADIHFSLDQGSVQGDNLLFNQPGLADYGFTVQGITNENPGTVYDISSNELIQTPSQGQALVEAVDGGLGLFFLQAHTSNVFFADFEANLRIEANTGGTATVTACNQFGSFGPSPTFTASGPITTTGPCESFTFDLDNGENFFVLTVSDLQLLSGVRIETTDNVFVDVRQIRIGGSQVGGNPVTPTAPEPASAFLLGAGFVAAGFRSYRRRLAAKTKTVVD